MPQNLIFHLILMTGAFSSCAHQPMMTDLPANIEAEKKCIHEENTFRCVKFLGNYDGDTISVDIPNIHPLLGKKIYVRIIGIDAAEMKSQNHCEKDIANKARNLLKEKLQSAQKINLFNARRDKYFRILADVEADHDSIKEFLLKNKLAVEYYGKTKHKTDWCIIGK